MTRRSSWTTLGALLLAACIGFAIWNVGRETPETSSLAPVEPGSEVARAATGDALVAGEVGAGATRLADEVPPAARTHGELASAVWIEGRVIFPPGTPADERARVVARGERFPTLGWHAADIAADGSFAVAVHPRSGSPELILEARYAYLERPARANLRSPEPVVLEPALGGCLTFVVRSPALRPDDARPTKLRASAVGDGKQLDAWVEADETGSFAGELGGLAPDVEHTLFVNGEGWPRIVHRAVRVAAGECEHVELLATVGVRLRGRIVDGNGAALAGVDVKSYAAFPDRETTTDATGAFALEGVTPGSILLRAALEGRPPVNLALGQLEDGERREDLEIVLSSGRVLTGRVVRPDGENAAGATVRLLPIEGRGGLVALGLGGTSGTLKTDADGRFEVQGLADVPFHIAARATGPRGTPWVADTVTVEPETSEVVLRLHPGWTLEGRVVDQSGAPVTQFEVAALPVAPSGSHAALRLPFEDPNGSFVLEGLVDGDVSLSARSDDHEPSPPVFVSLPAGGPIELVVLRVAALEGRVVDERGAAVGGARVGAVCIGQAAVFHSGRFESAEVVTDEEGAFRIAQIAPGSVNLTVDKHGFATTYLAVDLEPGGAAADVTLELRRGGSVVGHLVPRPGVDLQGHPIQLQQVHGGNHLDIEDTDEGGRFAFENVPAGRYLVHGYDDRQQATVDNDTVEVVLGQHEAGGVRLFGTVTRGERPVARASVRTEQPGSTPSTRTDDGGRYELTVSGAGSCEVSVFASLAGHELAIEIPADVTELRLDIALPEGLVRGRALTAEGDPAADLTVTIRGATGSAHARAAQDGSFELAGLSGGTWTLEAIPWEPSSLLVPYASPALELELEHGGMLEGVELRLEAPCTIEGRVTLPDGRPAIGAEILLSCVDVQRRLQTQTDGVGRYRVYCNEGRWRGRAAKDRQTSGIAELLVARATTVELDLTLAPGTVVQIAIDGIDAPIVPTVREVGIAGDVPLLLGDASWLELGGELRGRRVGPLPPGEYRALAQRLGAAGVEASGTFRVDGEPYREVLLERGR